MFWLGFDDVRWGFDGLWGFCNVCGGFGEFWFSFDGVWWGFEGFLGLRLVW